MHNLFPYVIREILISKHIDKNEFYMFSYAELFRNSEGMRILMLPKAEIVGKLKMNNILTAIFIAVIVLIVSVPLSWLASFIPSKLQATIVDAYEDIKKYTNIIDSNIATSRTDKNGQIIEVSSKFLDITGYDREDIIGKNHNILRHPDTPSEYYSEMWATISKGTVWSGEMLDICKSGKTFWIQQVITPEIGPAGEILSYTSVAQDITDKKLIEKMSITDSLTGLHNRHKLDSALMTEMLRFNRYKVDFCAILLDIDNFKRVNDTYGHQVGDEVLVEIANILTSNTRETDLAGRWGGEEFLILVLQSNIDNAFKLAEKIRVHIEATDFPTAGRVTASIGVSSYQYGETIANFVTRADNALYHAKDTGRNKVISADEINEG